MLDWSVKILSVATAATLIGCILSTQTGGPGASVRAGRAAERGGSHRGARASSYPLVVVPDVTRRRRCSSCTTLCSWSLASCCS